MDAVTVDQLEILDQEMPRSIVYDRLRSFHSHALVKNIVPRLDATVSFCRVCHLGCLRCVRQVQRFRRSCNDSVFAPSVSVRTVELCLRTITFPFPVVAEACKHPPLVIEHLVPLDLQSG